MTVRGVLLFLVVWIGLALAVWRLFLWNERRRRRREAEWHVVPLPKPMAPPQVRRYVPDDLPREKTESLPILPGFTPPPGTHHVVKPPVKKG